VDVDLFIGGNRWQLIQAEVEITRANTPDYVDMELVPAEDTIQQLPESLDDLIGREFTLDVDTNLISERFTDAEEVTRLFTGALANISPTGRKTYEGIAYTPTHQPLDSERSSILNQTVAVRSPRYNKQLEYFGIEPGENGIVGTQFAERYQIRADELLEKIIIDTLGLPEDRVNIMLSDGGTSVSGNGGEYTGGINELISFEERTPKILTALEKIKNRTKSEWWFDRYGDFYFGVPSPSKHSLRFITDADAGKTTPPYQSVKVIAGAAATEEDWSRTNMNIENKVVVEANIAKVTRVTDSAEGQQAETNTEIITNPKELREPTFVYRNAEIWTRQQAISVAQSVAEKLREQQADGTVSLVGFPEIRPFDGIVMPQAKDEGKPNYQPDKRMGGATYQVYKVVHKLNGTDGFKTVVHVARPAGVTRTIDETQQTGTRRDVGLTQNTALGVEDVGP